MEEVRYYEFAQRFREVLEEHADGMPQEELAKLLGTGQSTISKAKRGTKLPPDAVMVRIKELWGVDLVDYIKNVREANRYNVPSREKPLSPKKSYENGVPYYDVDFVGGFDMIINDQTTAPSYLVNFKPYDKATCWCNITGHSMEPEIHHGDMIALRRIEDWSFLPFGEIYAIVTRNDMRTVKRLGPGSTSDTYTLIPANQSGAYSPQEISKRDIMYVYEVMGCMKRF